MIFSEWHSVYYHTVAAILTRSLQGGMSEGELRQLVVDTAFAESAATILPALRSEKWQLLHPDGTTPLHHIPTMPLTLLEKRWLKAISQDPRIALFRVTFPDLDGVEPLFTREDYRIYDQYADGDPFGDGAYLAHFHLLREAIRTHSPVRITMVNRHGREVRVRFFPQGFEYSVKDDKIRVLASGCRFRYFNLARITQCAYYHGSGPWNERPRAEQVREVTLEITDGRNALERVMLHFAHFEKQAERSGEDRYLLHIRYYENDETEMVIRVLSFGPYVRVLRPDTFVALIRERLIAQKSCEL